MTGATTMKPGLISRMRNMEVEPVSIRGTPNGGRGICVHGNYQKKVFKESAIEATLLESGRFVEAALQGCPFPGRKLFLPVDTYAKVRRAVKANKRTPFGKGRGQKRSDIGNGTRTRLVCREGEGVIFVTEGAVTEYSLRCRENSED